MASNANPSNVIMPNEPTISSASTDLVTSELPQTSRHSLASCPTPTITDGYSSAEEGPSRKKARSHDDLLSSVTPVLPLVSDTGTSTAVAVAAQTEDDEDDDLQVSKPEDNFHLDEQLFNNMFASSETITHEYVPGSPRPIVIDGSNVAFSHGKQKHFSEKGILICAEYFLQRGHDVKVFVSRAQHGEFNRKTAKDLETRQILIFTPSRQVNGRRITPYDDRFILQYATVKNGIVVSNDNYRDLYDENEKYHEVIRKRLLQFTWPEDNVLMFPIDPLGRHGPKLEEFLKFPGTDMKLMAKNVETTQAKAEKSQQQTAEEDTSGYESSTSIDGHDGYESDTETDTNATDSDNESDTDL